MKLYIKIFNSFLLLIGFSSILTSCTKTDQFPLYPDAASSQVIYNWESIADSAQNSLTQFYNVSGKYYKNNNLSADWGTYWPTAHTLDVLVDGYIRTKDQNYLTKITDLTTGMYTQNGNKWTNNFYDDMEWMALASLRGYTATGNTTLKDITNTLWTDIKGGWSTNLGGGIWWNKDKGSKNTPSNMPAAILAARLYNEFGNGADLDWAKKIYAWEKSVLYDASTGWVKDNISAAGVKNETWKFTYNQGTFAGAAYELYKITGDGTYLNDAVAAADYAINNLSANGILKSEGEGDGGLFKGVLVRYLTRVIIDGGLPSDKKSAYINFLKTNAQSLWSKGTNKTSVLFGPDWNVAPTSQTDLTTQLSGIMLIEAMAELKKAGLL